MQSGGPSEQNRAYPTSRPWKKVRREGSEVAVDFDTLLQRFSRMPAANDEDIGRAERALERELPIAYKEFLRIANGGEGFIGEAEGSPRFA
jgi:hypothetical protein